MSGFSAFQHPGILQFTSSLYSIGIQYKNHASSRLTAFPMQNQMYNILEICCFPIFCTFMLVLKITNLCCSENLFISFLYQNQSSGQNGCLHIVSTFTNLRFVGPNDLNVQFSSCIFDTLNWSHSETSLLCVGNIHFITENI